MTVYDIRPANEADAPAIGAIWRSGWIDGHLGFVPEELVAERTEASFHRRAPQRTGDTSVAVTQEGNIAGFVMVVEDEVEQVYVSADHRGGGVADLLMSAAEQRVRSAGHTATWLAVVAGNARARSFYTRCGWTDAGLFDYRAAGEAETIAVPCHRYIKQLPPTT